jgi:hypothetical protein
MIEVFDRVPTYPGRVKLTPVAGQENTYDMVRNDAPTDSGTPLNRALFESIRTDLAALQTNVSDLIVSHAKKTLLASVPPGTEFVLFEDGIRVPFIKLAGEYSSTGRSLVIRKHICKMDTLTTSDQKNMYENCKTDLWLNDDRDGYLAKLDVQTRSAVSAVPVSLNIGNKSASIITIQRRVFLLSMTELGIGRADGLVEGIAVQYFSGNERRIAQFNGAVSEYWMRTPNYSLNSESRYVTVSGSSAPATSYNYVAGIRPAFTLPADFEIDLSVPNTGNTMATAEVI